MSWENRLTANLEQLEGKISAACKRAGRPRHEVKLMAVSKMHPAESIAAAFAAGIRLFGENRVQEFQQKSQKLNELGIMIAGFSGDGADAVHVHLIGHLQSNKTGKAAEIFTAIDTVDSLKLAQRINEGASRLNRRIPILIEAKLSTEVAKTGLDPASTEFTELVEKLPDLSNLEARGLMTVAPLDKNPEIARTCFRQLRLLRDQLASRYSRLDFKELSMGMSGDFEIAIEEGSTLVRIGTTIFGARPKPA
jgi:hypothetical protein